MAAVVVGRPAVIVSMFWGYKKKKLQFFLPVGLAHWGWQRPGYVRSVWWDCWDVDFAVLNGLGMEAAMVQQVNW